MIGDVEMTPCMLRVWQEERGATSELERQLDAAGRALRQATGLLKAAVVDGRRLSAADLLPLDVLGDYDLGKLTIGVHRPPNAHSNSDWQMQNARPPPPPPQSAQRTAEHTRRHSPLFSAVDSHQAGGGSSGGRRVATLDRLSPPEPRPPPLVGGQLPSDLEAIYREMQEEAGQLQVMGHTKAATQNGTAH